MAAEALSEAAEALLHSSLEAASRASNDQSHASDDELAFQVSKKLYLGTQHGARSQPVFETLNVACVINLTNGEHKVANEFASQGVTYINYELADQPGENILTRGIREGTREISARLQGSTEQAVLVHCMAGLSRSATVVVAWLMKVEKLTLEEAVARVSARRGRRLRINPSFWMVRSRLPVSSEHRASRIDDHLLVCRRSPLGNVSCIRWRRGRRPPPTHRLLARGSNTLVQWALVSSRSDVRWWTPGTGWILNVRSRRCYRMTPPESPSRVRGSSLGCTFTLRC